MSIRPPSLTQRSSLRVQGVDPRLSANARLCSCANGLPQPPARARRLSLQALRPTHPDVRGPRARAALARTRWAVEIPAPSASGAVPGIDGLGAEQPKLPAELDRPGFKVAQSERGNLATAAADRLIHQPVSDRHLDQASPTSRWRLASLAEPLAFFVHAPNVRPRPDPEFIARSGRCGSGPAADLASPGRTADGGIMKWIRVGPGLMGLDLEPGDLPGEAYTHLLRVGEVGWSRNGKVRICIAAAAAEILGEHGRFLGEDKEEVVKARPDQELLFNACVFDAKGTEIWFGDISLPADTQRLEKLADRLGEISLTPELPYRWEGLPRGADSRVRTFTG